ncbi:MAG: carbonate dehydratase [Candidatus Kapaibacterium sp.]
MDDHKHLLLENKAWALSKVMEDPEYFTRLSKIQSPKFMWIGCSDSRVPANEITGTVPGEIFVHRNVANMVVHTDLNLLSVLQYAVEVLHVEHVIVCGHYGCGGVKAAVTHQSFGIINKWLRSIKDVYRIHESELAEISNEDERVDRLVELNVQEQVLNLAKTSIIQRAWKYENRPHLHGWVYSLEDGLLKQIFTMPPKTRLDDLYEYDNL